MSIVSSFSKKIAELGAADQPHLGEGERICSDNSKTGYSVNFPLGPKWTCAPDPVCAHLCYGAIPGRPITWTPSIMKYVRVYRYFLSAPAAEIAERIHDEYVRYGMTFLRWNGVGDLFPESAAVLRELVWRYPEMVLYVITRKPDMVPLVPKKADNLYLMFSLNGSEESGRRRVQAVAHRHPRLYFSFLRRFADEDTLGARIVFNAQQYKNILPYDDPATTCPVDAGMIPLKDACAKCRKCFSPDVLDGRKHPGPKWGLTRNGSSGCDDHDAAKDSGARRTEMCYGSNDSQRAQRGHTVSKSEHTYLVYAKRNTSKLQEIRCRILDARTQYILVESLKRYNKKYAGAVKTQTGLYKGLPVRRVNRNQVIKIIDATTGKEVQWATVRRREGSQRAPGRARGGK